MLPLHAPAGADDVAFPDVPVPDLAGRFVRLRPIAPDDVGWIYHLSTLPDLGFRWRHVTGSTDPATFAQNLWGNVKLQLVATSARDGRRLGIVACYAADFVNRLAYVAGVLHPEFHGKGFAAEAFPLFVRHCFAAYDVRKLYAEVYDFNMKEYTSVLGRRVHREGIMRQHWWAGGTYHDVHLLAMYRDEWEVEMADLFRPDQGPAT